MASSLNEIESCEVCGNRHLHSVLDLGPHPMCDDLVPIGNSRHCRSYPIEILFCDTCRTAHQRFQIPKDQLFPPAYHYRSRQTADVLLGMKQLVEACARELGPLDAKKVLDIGCNDGSLLSFFRDRGARTFGIEPTDAADDAFALGHVISKVFLSADIATEFVRAHGAPDIITFTNVFAHIEDLAGVIRALTILRSTGTVLVIENHYLGAIVEKHQFDTFYHEHPRTYSFKSFTHIAESLGMYVSRVNFPERYGGNIRVFMKSNELGAPPLHHKQGEIDRREGSYGRNLVKLASEIELWRQRKRGALNCEYQRYGSLHAKAFPGRAAIPIKLLDLDERIICAVHEKPGSPKIGHYVPGTRIPILSDDELSVGSEEQSAPLLNLAWHIRPEIEAYLRKAGFRGRIIDVISQEDFAAPS